MILGIYTLNDGSETQDVSMITSGSCLLQLLEELGED